MRSYVGYIQSIGGVQLDDAAKTHQSVVCTVPNLPYAKLGPNARHHHYQRNKLIQSAKDGMLALLRHQGCQQSPLWEKGHLGDSGRLSGQAVPDSQI